MKISARLIAGICLTVSALTSCRREPQVQPEALLCPSSPILYGYKGPRADTTGEYVNCSAGNIDMATGLFTSAAGIKNRTYYNQGAYHMSENAYYTFKLGDTADTLYRVAGGSVTMLSHTSEGEDYIDGIVYDRFHNKLFCFVTTGSTSRISEVVISGSSYITNPVSYTTEAMAYDNATVDPATGDMYFQTHNPTTNMYSIRKYESGSSSTPAIIYSNPVAIAMWGLRYNRIDNMLYALRPSISVANTFDFVRLNPSTGIMTVIANLGFNINTKYLSAAINPCDNRYIFATQVVTTPDPIAFKLYQLNMTGAVVTSSAIPQMYQGLDMWY